MIELLYALVIAAPLVGWWSAGKCRTPKAVRP